MSDENSISHRERIFVRDKTLDARRKNVMRVTKKMIEQAIINANNGDKESVTVAKYHAAVNTKKHCCGRKSNL